jgi:GNAT superfamily N-acetyltransferase
VTRPGESDPPAAGSFGFDVRPAWRRDDAEIEADAIEFWTRHGLLPETVAPETRAKELLAAAYKDGRLVAVSTARIERIDFLKARFAMIRGATDPEYRRSHAQLALAEPSRQALEEWARANPDEKYAGGIVFVDRREWGDFARLPVWPESELQVVGYDQRDRQIRVRWFEDFYFGDGPSPLPLPIVSYALPPGIDVRIAWRRNDPQIERDAIDFWTRLGNLPSDVTPGERAGEILLAAYHAGRIVGITTAEVGILPQVRSRLAMLRGSVDPDYRRTGIGLAMYPRSLDALENWAAANPAEGVKGVGAIVEAAELVHVQRVPYWPTVRSGLIGFTPDGRQIRVRWFRDALLD